MNKKLIIWDFDGVIADTEKLWLNTWLDVINEKFGLNWDFETAIYFLGGMSDKTKQHVLEKMGLSINEDFLKEINIRNNQKLEKGFALTPDIEQIFSIKEFAQCIATGGSMKETPTKISKVGISSYFPLEKVFSADMVEHGKPAPDLFLFAAEKMGYNPEDCFVIEDSIAGMIAGMRAGMSVLAFLGNNLYNDGTMEERVAELGIKQIFYTMKDVKEFLLSNL